ncbi:TetR-like C-terminal domain-containing protein [Nocardioides sp.]|uniref:TetR/AcrR family transcriptional regulator n=1 Tax=Nocardioides sp. TaxID=35761 RepID=UPI00263048CC|nr:TetR-like C-terminal domain-containing protein [Nocardioides sp.]
MVRRGLTAEGIGVEGADLADEVGLAEVTISRVARRLGVRVPSLYAHLAGTEELMLWVTAVSLDDLAERVSAEIAGRSGIEALRAYADAFRAFAREHPGRYEASRRRVAGDAEGLETAREAAISAGRRHAELVAALLRGFAVTGDDVVHATRLIGSVIHGFVSLEAAGAFDHSTPAPEESWHRALTVLAGTLGA